MIDTESEPGAWEREIAMRPKTQEAGERVMDKYKLVPVEPTTEMRREWERALLRPFDYAAENTWKAMLAAAPAPPWIKVSERLPALEDADEEYRVWTWCPELGVRLKPHGFTFNKVLITHWMPKPRVQTPSPPERE